MDVYYWKLRDFSLLFFTIPTVTILNSASIIILTNSRGGSKEEGRENGHTPKCNPVALPYTLVFEHTSAHTSREGLLSFINEALTYDED